MNVAPVRYKRFQQNAPSLGVQFGLQGYNRYQHLFYMTKLQQVGYARFRMRITDCPGIPCAASLFGLLLIALSGGQRLTILIGIAPLPGSLQAAPIA